MLYHDCAVWGDIFGDGQFDVLDDAISSQYLVDLLGLVVSLKKKSEILLDKFIIFVNVTSLNV